MNNDLFLRACKRRTVERTPVWIMRQAGRYLPEYRAVRAKVDFLTLCKTPELAAEVTVQPVDILGVDAAIIFSDILVIPEAMGMRLSVTESHGPAFDRPIRTGDDIRGLAVADPERSLRFVLGAITQAKQALRGRVPLIGFAGSPWTLAAYMVEGGGSRDFAAVKKLMLDEPGTLLQLLDKLTVSVRLSLEAQMAAGADAVQLFDTWGGILPPDHYRKFSLEPMANVLAGLHPEGKPIIVFSKGAHHSLAELAQIGTDVIGLDWTIDMATARQEVGDRVALQGNLDPAFLYAEPEKIRHEVLSILKKFGKGGGHVFNLGHGILPDVPVDHAQALVRAVKEESPAFHG